MHGLEVPPVRAGGDVHGDNRVGEEIVAGTIAAPVICGGSGDRQVDETPSFIDSHRKRPDVRAGAAFPAVVEPRLVSDFAGPRHAMKLPAFLARYRVKRARVAGRSERDLVDGGA